MTIENNCQLPPLIVSLEETDSFLTDIFAHLEERIYLVYLINHIKEK